MTTPEAEEKYRRLGLVTRQLKDKPGFKYESHRHGGVYLYTIAGSLDLKLNGKWRTVREGEEVRIDDNQLHEAVVGSAGWEYIFAATAEEAKRQGL